MGSPKKGVKTFLQDVMGEKMNEWEATKRKRLLKPIDFDNKYLGGGVGGGGYTCIFMYILYICVCVCEWYIVVED